MRIHHLIDALDFGDAISNDCLALAQCFRDLGHESEIFTRYFKADLRQLAHPISEFHGAPEDIVMLHLSGWSGVLAEYVRFPGRRLLRYHGITPPEFLQQIPGMKGLGQWCYAGLAQLQQIAGVTHLGIGDSSYDADELAGFGFTRIGVIPVVLSLDRITSAPFDKGIVDRYRHSGVVNLLFVGRLSPNKRADDLVRLLAAYRQCCTAKVRLLLVGATDELYAAFVDSLRMLAASLCLVEGSDYVITGKVTDEEVHAYYRAADAFVSMSEHEGFGVPLVEAMALGVPTFGFARAAVPETIGSGGELFTVKDFPELAKRIHALITDPDQRAALVLRQRERIREFDLPVTKEKFAKLLAHLEDGNFLADTRSATSATLEAPVSVVINTYNRAPFLRRALSVLQQQTYRNFEVIVVNGPSTDETESVLLEFPDVRKLTTDQRNLAISRNVGIRAARGDIIAFLDDDAVPRPDWLNKVANCFQDSQVGAVGGLVLYPDGQRAQFRNGTISLTGSVIPIRKEPGECNDPNGSEFNTTMGTNSAFLRVALYDIGLFDEEFGYYHDEADISVRLIRNQWKVVHAPDAVVVHDFALGPHRPTHQPYQLNWYHVVKNTVYFAVKHRPPPKTLDRHLQAVDHDLYEERFAGFRRWLRNGEIDEPLYRKIMEDSWRGVWDGYVKGLHYQVPVRESAPYGPIHRYANRSEPNLRICILTQDLPWIRPGGVADYSWRLARGLRKLGQQVHVIARGPAAWNEDRDGVLVHYVAPAQDDLSLTGQPIAEGIVRYSLAVARKLAELEQSGPFDVVESPLWDSEGLVYSLRRSAKLVVRLQTPLARAMAANGWASSTDLQICLDFERRLLARADGVIGISHHILEDVRKSHEIDTSLPTAVIPVGVAVPEAFPPPLPDKPACEVLFVGRLERRKGIIELLEAIPRVVAAVAQARFILAGRDERPFGRPTQEYFVSTVPAAVAERVQFRSEIGSSELQSLYRDCDVFVAPSLYESLGIVFLEAMRHGKPVIGTNVGGVPEVVQEGITGLLVAAGNSDELASAIIRLLTDENLRRRLGHAGYDRVREHFDEEQMCAETLRFYRSLRSDSLEVSSHATAEHAPESQSAAAQHEG